MNNEQIRLQLVAEADRANEKWPQYKNHFDNYRLAKALKNIKNKYREVMFPKGSHLLVDTNSIHKPDCGPYINTFFIYGVPRAGIVVDTSIRLKDIEVQE